MNNTLKEVIKNTKEYLKEEYGLYRISFDKESSTYLYFTAYNVAKMIDDEIKYKIRLNKNSFEDIQMKINEHNSSSWSLI